MALGQFPRRGDPISEASKDSDGSHSKCSRFSGGTGIAGFKPEDFVRSWTKNWVIWVREDEARVLLEVVIPSIRKKWKERRLIVCDFDSSIELDQSDVPLVLIDAAKANSNSFRVPLGCGFDKFLRNRDNPLVIYVFNSGNAQLNFVHLIRLWGEGYLLLQDSSDPFDPFMRGPDSNSVFVSGVWGREAAKNCIDLRHQTGFFSVAGIDW